MAGSVLASCQKIQTLDNSGGKRKSYLCATLTPIFYLKLKPFVTNANKVCLLTVVGFFLSKVVEQFFFSASFRSKRKNVSEKFFVSAGRASDLSK